MQAALGTADVQNPEVDNDKNTSKRIKNHIVGDIAGKTGKITMGDTITNTNVNNENRDKKPAPHTPDTPKITSNYQIGKITGIVNGPIIVGDQTFNISLKSSDIEDKVMDDIAAGKLAPNTEAGSDYHKLSESQKVDIKNKMKDAMNKQKAKWMKSLPALIEKDYTSEQRNSADPETRAKIQADLDRDAERFLKELQAGHVPLFERLMKGGDADAPLQIKPTLEQGDSVQPQNQASDNLFIGDGGKLMQYSVCRGEVTKDYGKIIETFIWSMVQTSDKKYLFVSGSRGN
jgi:hypothetical protein